MKRAWVFMIIAIGMLCPLLAGAQVKLPDPVTFSVQMENGNAAQAQEWLSAGLPPDFVGARVGTGLMIGAWEGKLEVMRVFLANGADINLVNSNGESALALAAWKGRTEIVKWLLERGARINAPPRSWSALHYAVFGGHQELANFLIEQGADINARSTNGSTPLMMAIYEGKEDLARRLIEKGADRRVKNDWGDGALEWAMRGNRLKLARMVTSPEEFNIAVAEPKEKWGTAQRSVAQSHDLEVFLRVRDELIARGMPTQQIDQRIAAERARIMRQDLDRSALPPRATVLEVTVDRNDVRKQSAAIVSDKPAASPGFKVPAATYSGKPKMPPKAPTKNY